MSKSNLMKAAHKIAKQTVAIVGDYLIALKLALKTVWKNVKGESMKGTEKQVEFAKKIIAERKEKVAAMAADKKLVSYFWGTDTEAPEFNFKVATDFIDGMNDAEEIIANREVKLGALYAASTGWEFEPEVDEDFDINEFMGF